MKTQAGEARRTLGLVTTLASMLLAVAFAGCSGNVSSRTDIDLNGHRKVTQVLNGVRRTLETRDAVVFLDGNIVRFPPGTVVQLSEKQGRDTRTAELREEGGKLELWMKADGTFRKGTAEDRAWLERFLQALRIDDGGKQKPAPDRRDGIVQGHVRQPHIAAHASGRC